MELWSSSFSGKTITAKTLAMNEAIDDLRDAVLDLKSAALGKEAGGEASALFWSTSVRS